MNPNQYQIAMRPVDLGAETVHIAPFTLSGFLDELLGGTPPLFLTTPSPMAGTLLCST